MGEEAVPDLVTLVETPEWKGILLDLVRSEKMDPWDVDIVRLAQKYLERIRSMRENNLYVPANALLACAILLNLKADVLRQYYDALFPQQEEGDEAYVEDFAFAFDFFPEPEEAIPSSDSASEPLPTPASVLPPSRLTTRKITLDELLSAMERIMKAKKRARKVSEAVKPVDILLDEMEREDVDKLIEETYQRILSSLDSEGITTLSRILPERNALSLVRTFLSVLYLANDGKVNVWQERPFDEVFISVVEDGKAESAENN